MCVGCVCLLLFFVVAVVVVVVVFVAAAASSAAAAAAASAAATAASSAAAAAAAAASAEAAADAAASAAAAAAAPSAFVAFVSSVFFCRYSGLQSIRPLYSSAASDGFKGQVLHVVFAMATPIDMTHLENSQELKQRCAVRHTQHRAQLKCGHHRRD